MSNLLKRVSVLTIGEIARHDSVPAYLSKSALLPSVLSTRYHQLCPIYMLRVVELYTQLVLFTYWDFLPQKIISSVEFRKNTNKISIMPEFIKPLWLEHVLQTNTLQIQRLAANISVPSSALHTIRSIDLRCNKFCLFCGDLLKEFEQLLLRDSLAKTLIWIDEKY